MTPRSCLDRITRLQLSAPNSILGVGTDYKVLANPRFPPPHPPLVPQCHGAISDFTESDFSALKQCYLMSSISFILSLSGVSCYSCRHDNPISDVALICSLALTFNLLLLPLGCWYSCFPGVCRSHSTNQQSFHLCQVWWSAWYGISQPSHRWGYSSVWPDYLSEGPKGGSVLCLLQQVGVVRSKKSIPKMTKSIVLKGMTLLRPLKPMGL